MKAVIPQPEFLPMTRLEMEQLGWKELDILLVAGDAYVDHPSFGPAVIGRYLIQAGYRVGIIAQPDWRHPSAVAVMGRPRLWAGVTAGAMDSMVANYTANKKLRRQDAYTPGGVYGKRPNRASIIYTNLLKQQFPKLPIVLGGIEASLRRLAHYDYWSHQIRRSILLDAKADYILYGMAELSARQLTEAIANQAPVNAIPGLVYASPTQPEAAVITVPGYEAINQDWSLLIEAALKDEANQNRKNSLTMVQPHGQRLVVVTPPRQPMTTGQLDAIYALPFQRRAHPSYQAPVPALQSVQHSIVTHRGCFGGCTFCALGAHQGKQIQSRSEASILNEVEQLVRRSDFRGTITDVGGPSANMYSLTCLAPDRDCARPSCLYPDRCRDLQVNQAASIRLLKKIKAIKQVKHVFVASGIRYDLALADKRYIQALVQQGHVSGRLKVAPEHHDDQVLRLMRKPSAVVFERFVKYYRETCREAGCHDGLTGYVISAFPGSDQESIIRTAQWANKLRLRIEQLQDFIPLPMTMAGVMYATGKNPWTRRHLHIPSHNRQRRAQRQTLLGRHAPDHRQRKRK